MGLENLRTALNDLSTNSNIRKRDESVGKTLGADNRLGVTDKYGLDSLFDPTHGSNQPSGRPAGIGSTKHLNIKESGTIFRGGALGLLKEPYIVHNIPDRNKGRQNGQDRDFIPWRAAADDVLRVLNYTTSPSGLLSILKENVTNQIIGSYPSNNPAPLILNTKIGGDLNTINKTLLPPIPLLNTGFLNFTHQFRDLPGVLGSLRKPFVVEYSQRPKLKLPFNHLGDKPLDSVIFGRTYEWDSSHNKKSKFLGMGSGKRHTSKDKIAQSGVEQHSLAMFNSDLLPLEDGLSGKVEKGDFYVRIKDLRDDKYIYFRGYVTGITENVTPSFTAQSYIGRSEDVYVYEKGERDLSFNLKVYPANAKENDLMYEKINRLTSLAYPKYEKDVNHTSLVRMKAPFTELYMGHIGERNNKGQFGFIKSLTYNVPDGGDWDALNSTPRMFDIAIGYQILSKKPPSLTDKFYPGVYGANR